MFTNDTLQQGRTRHARYYLHQLQALNDALQSGEATPLLQKWDTVLLQLQQAFEWLRQNLHYPDAASLCSDLPRVGGEVLERHLPAQERIEWIQAGLQAARQLGDTVATVDHLTRLGQLHLITKSAEDARTIYDEALQLADRIDYAKGKADAWVGLARVSMMNPNAFDQARRYLENALAVYQQLGDDFGVGWSLHNLGTAEQRYGDLSQARQHLEQAIMHFQQSKRRRNTVLAMVRLASIAEQQQAYDDAKALALEALHLAEDLGDDTLIVGALQPLALIVSWQGDLARSQFYFERALALVERTGNKMYRSTILFNLGWLAGQRHQFDTAERTYQQALDIARDNQNQWRVAITLVELAMIHIQQSDLDAARRELLESLHLMQTIGREEDHLVVLPGLAWLAMHDGNPIHAAQMMGFAMRYPSFANEPEFADKTQRLLNQLRLRLPPAQLEAALQTGRDMPFAAMFDPLLGEVSSR